MDNIQRVQLVRRTARARTNPNRRDLIFTRTIFTNRLIRRFTFRRTTVRRPNMGAHRTTNVTITVNNELLRTSPFQFINTNRSQQQVNGNTHNRHHQLTRHRLRRTLNHDITTITLTANSIHSTIGLFIDRASVGIRTRQFNRPHSGQFTQPAPINATRRLTSRPTMNSHNMAVTLAQHPPQYFNNRHINRNIPIVRNFKNRRFTRNQRPNLITRRIARNSKIFTNNNGFKPMADGQNIRLRLTLNGRLRHNSNNRNFNTKRRVNSNITIPNFNTVLINNANPGVSSNFATSLGTRHHTSFLKVIRRYHRDFTRHFRLGLMVALGLRPRLPTWALCGIIHVIPTLGNFKGEYKLNNQLARKLFKGVR